MISYKNAKMCVVFLCKALRDGRLLPKVERDHLLHDVQWHIHLSGFREQLVQSRRSTLQQVHHFTYLLTVCYDDTTGVVSFSPRDAMHLRY